MSGFNKELERKKYNGKVSKIIPLQEFVDLLSNGGFSDEPVSYSTNKGTDHFYRGYTSYSSWELIRIELEGEMEGLYAPFDAGAGEYYGYDEFKPIFRDDREFWKVFNKIYIPEDMFDRINHIEEIISNDIDNGTNYYDDDLDSDYQNLYENYDKLLDEIGGSEMEWVKDIFTPNPTIL